MTAAEVAAEKATTLPPFPINLAETRRNVEMLLSQVGKGGFFEEFTLHSFQHVFDMLGMLDWVIPPETKKTITSAEWLLLVLSIYFHDLGLVITKEEFSKRGQSDFREFCESVLFAGDNAADYHAKISLLSEEERERILYQEYVRYNHGRRVRDWIEKKPKSDDPTAGIRLEIQAMLGKLDPSVKIDLGVLCESHTLDDLQDTQKYKTAQAYGSSDTETANLQYIGVVLRTCDLLQITRARAPSPLFRLINPVDPLSQVEWQKQNAVRAVRPAAGLDRDGNADIGQLSDTIKVFARFSHAEGFFGLTSYLNYAEGQLQASHAALAGAQKVTPRRYQFPWRFIDTSNVEAEGFEAQTFGFELDQERILNLLTGHTLYNDTRVVLRELAQNAIDAVRLQGIIDDCDPVEHGKVCVQWNSQARELIITDNGTGMTQEVIENHLLKVGSSRYQTQRFQERFPTFTSISQFGIGVLSAFMVADTVVITTCTTADEPARQISLRSVHGKYLVRLLDKTSKSLAGEVIPHGTRISLKLRPSAELGDVLEAVRAWVMFPRCKVSVVIDDLPPLSVGFASPSDAIEAFLSEHRDRFIGKRNYKVVEETDGGVTLAYALLETPLFKDWSFVSIDESERPSSDDMPTPPTAICVEGIGVEFTSPGFKGRSVLSVANVVGPGAPRTNVARSSIDDTPEHQETLKKIYGLYASHVSREIRRLEAEEGYSLSWAVQEAPYILEPLTGIRTPPKSNGLLNESLNDIPILLVEDQRGRVALSLREIIELPCFYTVESPLVESAEFFVKESASNITARQILEISNRNSLKLPDGPVLCNLRAFPLVRRSITTGFEIDNVVADQENRTLEARWVHFAEEQRWLTNASLLAHLRGVDLQLWNAVSGRGSYSRYGGTTWDIRFAIPLSSVSVVGLDEYGSFYSNGVRYYRPTDPLATFLADLWADRSTESVRMLVNFISFLGQFDKYSAQVELDARVAKTFMRGVGIVGGDDEDEIPGLIEFVAAYNASKARVFNPFAWKRKEKKD